MAKTDTEILNDAIKKMNKLEKDRLEALQPNIKMGCEKCSQFDEIFGCSKCEQTLSI